MPNLQVLSRCDPDHPTNLCNPQAAIITHWPSDKQRICFVEIMFFWEDATLLSIHLFAYGNLLQFISCLYRRKELPCCSSIHALKTATWVGPLFSGVPSIVRSTEPSLRRTIGPLVSSLTNGEGSLMSPLSRFCHCQKTDNCSSAI